MDTKYIIQSFNTKHESVGYLSAYSANGQNQFSLQAEEAVTFDRKKDCVYSDGQKWELENTGEKGYYKIIIKIPHKDEPLKSASAYTVEITSITVGGTDVKLSKEQGEKLAEKIKKYGSDDVNVNAYIMQIVDENRGQEYFKNPNPEQRTEGHVEKPFIHKPDVVSDSKQKSYSIEITSITIDGVETKLNKEQVDKLESKVKQFGGDSGEVYRYIIHIYNSK